MQYSIQIPKPCHESWDEMTPTAAGRHCTSCSKTVVDFTGWQQGDILHYLQQQGDAKICGRFRSEQVNTPISIGDYVICVARSPLPLYRKIAAILLLAFGMIQVSCDSDTHTGHAGVPAIAFVDTVKKIQVMVGEAISQPAVPQKPDSAGVHKKAKKISRPERHIKGDIAIEEITPPQPPPIMMGGAIPYPLYDTVAADTTIKGR